MSKPNNNDICDNLFTDEWHSQVHRVIDHTLNLLDKQHIKHDKLLVAKQIIDYNIQKTFNERLESTPIPDSIDMSLSTHIEAIDDFQKVYELFRLHPNLSHHIVSIYIGANKFAEKQLFLWEEWINAEQPEIEVTLNVVSDMIIECLFTRA